MDKIYQPEHKGIYGFQGIFLLQKRYLRKYKRLSGALRIFVSEITKIWYDTPQQDAGFFALNAVNLSEANEKLSRTMSATMKETLKKVFPDVSSLEHKNVPVIKEVETINFNCSKNANEKNLIEEETKEISLINKVG